MKNSLKIRKLKTENLKVKDFINEFNFPDPNWEKLPNGFPNVARENLTREEVHLLDGIVLTWMASHRKGHIHIFKKTLKSAGFAIAIIGTIAFSRNFIKSPGWHYVRQVSAATISATLRTSGIESSANELNNIFESTMSGVLKPKIINKNHGN